jgi:hypothetical protein
MKTSKVDSIAKRKFSANVATIAYYCVNGREQSGRKE